MKKLLIIPILIFISLEAYANLYGMYYLDLALRPGVNMASTLQESNSNYNLPTYTLGAELGVNLGYVTLGAGIHHNQAIEFEGVNGSDGSIQTMPLYGFAKLNLFPLIFKPYVVGKFGRIGVDSDEFSVSHDSMMGLPFGVGSYWALGMGIDIYNFLAEFVYQNSYMTIDGQDETLTQLQLSIGIKLF